MQKIKAKTKNSRTVIYHHLLSKILLRLSIERNLTLKAKLELCTREHAIVNFVFGASRSGAHRIKVNAQHKLLFSLHWPFRTLASGMACILF